MQFLYMSKKKENKVSTLSFEQAMQELETIAHVLESQEVEIEKAISLYQRGNEMHKHCEKILNEAKMQVEKIMIEDGKIAKREDFTY